MLSLVLVFCLVMFIVGLIFEKKKLNPITLFFGEWTIILYLASLNLFNIISAQQSTYQIIFIGVLAFAVGFYLYNIFSKKITLFYRPSKTFYINKRWILIVGIISIIFFSFDFFKSLPSLLHGQSLGIMRQDAQSGVLFSNPLLNAIRIIIATPFSWAITAVAAANLFSKDRKKWLLVMASIIILMRVLSDGGRSVAIFFILSLIVSYSYTNTSRKNKGKSKFKIVALLILGFILLYGVTISRSGDNTQRFTYYYFAMEPIMAEKWMNIIQNNGLIGYGMASFNGILFAFFYLTTNIFQLGSYPVFWKQIYDTIEGFGTQWQIITTTGSTANSYVSIFTTFYLDGRIIGVVLGMLIYGLWIAYIYNKCLRNRTEHNIAIYSFSLIGVFYTFQQFIFQNIYYAIGFIMLVFFMYKKEKMNNNEGISSNT